MMMNLLLLEMSCTTSLNRTSVIYLRCSLDKTCVRNWKCMFFFFFSLHHDCGGYLQPCFTNRQALLWRTYLWAALTQANTTRIATAPSVSFHQRDVEKALRQRLQKKKKKKGETASHKRTATLMHLLQCILKCKSYLWSFQQCFVLQVGGCLHSISVQATRIRPTLLFFIIKSNTSPWYTGWRPLLT